MAFRTNASHEAMFRPPRFLYLQLFLFLCLFVCFVASAGLHVQRHEICKWLVRTDHRVMPQLQMHQRKFDLRVACVPRTAVSAAARLRHRAET